MPRKGTNMCQWSTHYPTPTRPWFFPAHWDKVSDSGNCAHWATTSTSSFVGYGCVMSPWPSVENCLPKLGLTMIPQPELQAVRDDSLTKTKPSKLLQLAELEICEFHSGFCTIEEVWEHPLLNIPSLRPNAKTSLCTAKSYMQRFDSERSQTSILATHSSLAGLKWFEIRNWKPFCLLHHQVATDLLNIAANVTLPSCCQCWEPQILPETFGDWCLTHVEISHVCRIWIDVDCHVRRSYESHHPTASHTHLMDSSGNQC